MSIISFSYTAHKKGQYLSMWGAFLFLTLSENLLFFFLVLHFVPVAVLQTLILALDGGFTAAMFGKLLWPLWTTHRLLADELELHYGLDLHARLPLAQLASARPAQEKPGPFAIPRYDASRKRIALAFSEHGQVVLSLKQPVTLRLLLHSREVEQILVNLDDRAAFLAALDLPRDVSL